MEQNEWLSAFFICLSANTDVLAAAIGQHKQLLSGHPVFNIGCIVGCSTLITTISCLFGKTTNEWIPPNAANAVSGVVFMLLAAYALKEEFFPQKRTAPTRHSGILLLSLTLACNNAGLGLAYGVSGKGLIPIAVFTLFFTLLACLCGIFCAKKLRRYLSERSLNLLSNTFLFIFGLLQLLHNLVPGRF